MAGLRSILGQLVASEQSFLVGPPWKWANDLAELALTYGVSGFILAVEDAATIQRFAAEVAPATRELVAAARARETDSVAGRQRVPSAPT